MVSQTELIQSRRMIDAIIRADPVTVVLRRRQKVDDGAGGWRWGDYEDQEPQQAALIPFKRRMTEYLIDTQEGFIPDLPYVLLGRHDFDLRRGDLFWIDGDEFKVETLDIKKGIRVAAQVDFHGGESDA